MENNFGSANRLLAFIEQLRPYAANAEAYGRVYGDLVDLTEACRWLLSAIDKNLENVLSPSELEDVLVDIDIKFVQHVTYHLNSLRSELPSILSNLSKCSPDDA